MAYAQTTPVVTQSQTAGRRYWHITFSETEASSTSEWTIPESANLPKCGTITLYKAKLTAGTGTTIQPAVGRATGWTASTMDHIEQVSAATAFIHDTTGLRYDLLATTRALFGRSTPNNAAADHSVSTELTIIDGHP